MKDSLFNFKDDKEREEFIIVIPVLLFFAWLGYYLLGNSAPSVSGDADVVAIASDIDGDGVADSEDQCTVTAGTAKNFGCPTKVTATLQDSDGDGIANLHDRCPNSRGTSAYNGCAPTGNNTNTKLALNSGANSTGMTGAAGFTSNTEQTGSAEVTGSTAITDSTGTDLTTVDSDEDGVNDLTDQCPTLAGSVDYGGCPIDTDGDTIADAEDRCPALSGVAANLGCPPDGDKDGVYDPADNCPGVAGTAEQNGCPADRDADGVIDAEDQCPDQAASTDSGCPTESASTATTTTPTTTATTAATTATATTPETDSDGDGVADSIDVCPNRMGDSRFQGCPSDTDADGVSDTDDQCPNTQGPIDNNGCPLTAEDTDGDGVADANDLCPAISGLPTDGCPVDTDGDGVADDDDLCNGVVGTIELRGCAPASEEQTTGGQTTGISVADQQILDNAVAQVAFNSSSATLTTRSREILREIAELLKKYPNAFLEISGHTDSTGVASQNMNLSMDRARACAAFIAAEGITIDRLFAYGYGESQPITSNASLEGRKLNRRVEFNLKFP